jgi:hypothetical protein
VIDAGQSELSDATAIEAAARPHVPKKTAPTARR